MVSRGDRAQAFTLEGFVAALLLLATVAFVINATAVTPVSSSTSSQYAQTQGSAMVEGVVDAGAANASLRPTLLYWNNSTGEFHDVTVDGTYANCDALPTAFGSLLARTVYDQGWACNVNVHYLNATTDTREIKRVVFSGTPSDTAVRAVRTVTLYDDDTLYDASEVPTNTAVGNQTTYFVTDTDPTSGLYAVVELEVVVWRT